MMRELALMNLYCMNRIQALSLFQILEKHHAILCDRQFRNKDKFLDQFQVLLREGGSFQFHFHIIAQIHQFVSYN